MMWRLPLVLSLLITAACSKTSGPNKFADPVLAKIYDLKDRRSTDSLLFYLRSENPIYRVEAALAFGSVQDTLASTALGNTLLEDPDDEVRRNAAFALGQTGGFQAVNALIPALQHNERTVVREVLEALGKTIQQSDLNDLKEFETNDTLLQEGQAWGFYQLAIRKKTDSVITKKVLNYLRTVSSYQARLASANYFGRSTKVEGKGFEETLINAALHDKRAEVRMAAVSGFRHLDIANIIPSLKNIFTDNDYRVRVSAVRVCQNFPITETQEVVFGGLKDSIEMVQVAASEVIRNIADRYPLKRISEEVAASKNWRVKANLYGASLKANSNDETLEGIIKLYSTAPLYFKAVLASALGEAKSPLDEKSFKFLSKEMLNKSSEKVIRTATASAIVSMNRRTNNKIPKKEFLEIYKQAIAQGDVAVIGIVSSALRDESLHYKEEIKDLRFLYDAKAKLTLPRDIESLEPLDRAIAYLEGKERAEALKNEFNHPIDWNFVKTIPADQQAEIRTTKGNIVIQLLVEEAPGSAANFVELVRKKYFDGKFFHRVVPNFVIQGGCNRGDGYGSEDYSIRSEFSLRRYTTGSVGMASAGKDTEGTQWFITHLPTPHLDGKYTIFAETKQGMKVVDHMEVGETILELRLINN